MTASNCSGEKSFSNLKRIKNEVRSCMGQQRLCSQSLMSIENNIVNSLDCDGIINDVAIKKLVNGFVKLPILPYMELRNSLIKIFVFLSFNENLAIFRFHK